MYDGNDGETKGTRVCVCSNECTRELTPIFGALRRPLDLTGVHGYANTSGLGDVPPLEDSDKVGCRTENIILVGYVTE